MGQSGLRGPGPLELRCGREEELVKVTENVGSEAKCMVTPGITEQNPSHEGSRVLEGPGGRVVWAPRRWKWQVGVQTQVSSAWENHKGGGGGGIH